MSGVRETTSAPRVTTQYRAAAISQNENDTHCFFLYAKKVRANNSFPHSPSSLRPSIQHEDPNFYDFTLFATTLISTWRRVHAILRRPSIALPHKVAVWTCLCSRLVTFALPLLCSAIKLLFQFWAATLAPSLQHHGMLKDGWLPAHIYLALLGWLQYQQPICSLLAELMP